MLDSINIQGFRKYENFTIDGFGQINFILGDNNIGKTSVLEAIFAWACGQNSAPFVNIPLARGRYSNIQLPYWIMEELLAMVNNRKSLPLKMVFDGVYNGEHICFEHSVYPSELLSNYDTSYKNLKDLSTLRGNSSISGDTTQISQVLPSIFQIPKTQIARWEIKKGDSTVSTNIDLPIATISEVKSFHQAKYIDVLSHIAVSENVQIYASLKRENKLDEVAKEIKKAFPEVLGFDMIPYPDGTQAPVSIIKENGLLPLYACGDGIQRWYYILGAFALYKNSIICIDEIDTGFHYAAQEEFSANLVENAIKNNVQLFITTHNVEFLDRFLKANKDLDSQVLEQIKVITMRNTSEGIKARVINAKEAYSGRIDFNLELR